ncbi:MAG: lectin [Vicinamibacterales bacterium]
MRLLGRYLTGLAAALGALSAIAFAQAPAAPPQAPPQQPMTFFITSTPKGDGANYGGLAGADAHCQQLAAAAGRGAATWRAYLSTQGPGGVNARDRIGTGPWYNAQGRQVASNLDELHGDTIERARLGNRLNKNTSLTEKGAPINGVGDTPNQHDIMTGSLPDGRAYTDGLDHTCGNYTSNADVAPLARGTQPPAGAAPVPGVQFGHHDRIGNNTGSWNSAHGSRGCSQRNVMAGGGNGLLYCFAVN